MSWVLVVLIGLLCGSVCLAIASAKNISRTDAFLVGLLLGPIGVVIEACKRSNRPDKPAAGFYLDAAGKTRHWDGHAWGD